MNESGESKSQPPQGVLIRLTDASQAERARMARMKKTGKAIQLAPQLYVVGSQLDTKDVVRIHFYEIAASFWPDGVFVGKSALSPNLKDNNEFLYPIQTRHDLPRSFLRASRSFRCLEYVRIGGSEKIKRP